MLLIFFLILAFRKVFKNMDNKNQTYSNNNGFISDDNLTSTRKILSLLPYFLSITVISSILWPLSTFLSLLYKETASFILGAGFLVSFLINIIPFTIIWNPKLGKIAQKLSETEKTNLSIVLVAVLLFFNNGLIILIADLIIKNKLSKILQPGGFYANILNKSSKILIILSIISFIIFGILVLIMSKMFML